jgi:hypothetical protein
MDIGASVGIPNALIVSQEHIPHSHKPLRAMFVPVASETHTVRVERQLAWRVHPAHLLSLDFHHVSIAHKRPRMSPTVDTCWMLDLIGLKCQTPEIMHWNDGCRSTMGTLMTEARFV